MATLPYSGGSRTNIPGPGAAGAPGAAGTPVSRETGARPKQRPKRQESRQAAPPASKPPARDDAPDDVDERDETPAEGRGRPGGSSSPRRVRLSVGRAGGDASGVVLALLVWGWVVLPFLGVSFDGKTETSGITGVRDVWRAKFLNKGPNGAWLP